MSSTNALRNAICTHARTAKATRQTATMTLPMVVMLLLSLVLTSGISSTRAQPQCDTCIKTIVTLGTTISDAGLPYGLWSYNNGTYPPNALGYMDGRFSNGPVWSEVIATSRNLTHLSFAVAGSTINNVTDAPTTLAEQLAKYQAYAANPSNTLPQPLAVAIEFGSSDLLDLASNSAIRTAKNATAAALQYIGNIPDGIAATAKALIASGHQNIILLTVPPLQLTPLLAADPDTEHVTQLGAVLSGINKAIRDTVTKLNLDNPDVNVILFDVNYWMTLASRSPSTYGFENSTAACMTYTLNTTASNDTSTTNATDSNSGSNNKSNNSTSGNRKLSALADPLDSYGSNATNATVDSNSTNSNATYVLSVCPRPAVYFYWDMMNPSLSGHRFLAKVLLPILRGLKLTV